jgi:hypothetical protein
MTGSIIKLNVSPKDKTNTQAKAETHTTQEGKRGDNVAEYQKYVTMPACIYNLLEYPEHGGGKLLFSSCTYVPINMTSYPIILES